MDLALPASNQPRAQLYSFRTQAAGHTTVGRFVTEEEEDQIVINFPNLPDEIDISRTSEWKVALGTLIPDGIHIFDHTAPLEIPFMFKVHALDDYAINGPETILQIAAKLHALQLPIIKNETLTLEGREAGPTLPPSGQESKPPTVGAGASAGNIVTGAIESGADDTRNYGADYFFPPACVLNLMLGSGGYQGLGICCIGYVKNVNTKLKGPWLNSGRDDINRNLPSAGEFSFTFVHAPTYTNRLQNNGRGKQSTTQVGAFRMKNQFYNTIDVAQEAHAEISYGGLK